MDYNAVVSYLESLTIMPKTMPGLEKIRSAVASKPWFGQLDSRKIITIAGTNGKGTTAAALEALLLEANQKVGLYTSPHLVTTTERIRVNGDDISKEKFIKIFEDNKAFIEQFELSHFESLTLMAADFFFSDLWNQNLDYVIFEVGLGGLYDATNIFPNYYSVITKIGFDHENILGRTLTEIAQNKFGIVKNKSLVIHHQLDSSLEALKSKVIQETQSEWIKAESWQCEYINGQWEGYLDGAKFVTNLIGPRAIENTATAITVFKTLGFDFNQHATALCKIKWPGRMQKVKWPTLEVPIYLSGDHNSQGIDSLIEILKHYKYQDLHLIVGIGIEKDAELMLDKIAYIPNVKIYLTETPFKGRSLSEYPEKYKALAVSAESEIAVLLSQIKAGKDDLVVVTGSLYLVGKVLNLLK